MVRGTKWAACFFAVVTVLSAGLLVLKGSIYQVPSGTWGPLGSSLNMASPRAGASTVLLQDGRLLITGGDSGAGALASAETFDTSGNFSAAASMNFARSQHTAVVLQDGRLLVAGGMGADGKATDTTELYDPNANTWTGSGPLMAPRSGHTASLLQDGTVLIARGQ